VSDLQKALTVALRHSDEASTSEAEREAILAAAAETFSGPTGEVAAQTLFHLREQRRLQLTLRGLLEGIK